ncbi:molybdopterin-guanine dinucleotide biosynthesis protein MobB [Alkalihalobacillus alcalophilus ATCC 27647 = CGMCC 1.3604]|uniref:Molybdopterin-guanine dinucleotide biosynthesis protein MobB n=1 Tax=Alkalihalobacillus alcalophilus ATCC 27647 = CGMCC 1.3604 TaxID=1218173 RepID=A0A4S4K3C0_ALKAL|nr:molybdopterin-guanine dinucleotide biosynthesis protein B [Alkalihalobacillus alcalophilus]MED1561385.1 molybdopterin-guanine dinucleotide biosynthesis protein B [Alkalihalobacillus alcalophilus]THG92183.1 molybdopterin-guanine dinucleotide biosynthesis protein MobB [Alkalihalobacillus alcalophilus ATCC 27647 = CGMCC 1.3604]
MDNGLNTWQISGFSNRGKTTLIEGILRKSKKRGLSIATIKHHGHGKKLAALDTGKDSWKHRQAGAVGSAVLAAETLQIQISKPTEWQLEDLLPLYEQADLDVILLEGYKNKTYPKLVLLKEEADLVLLSELTNIQAVVVWEKNLSGQIEDKPVFFINDVDEISEWLFKQWGV